MRETHHLPALVRDASKDISNQETEFLPKPKKLEIMWKCRFLFATTYQHVRAFGSSGESQFLGRAISLRDLHTGDLQAPVCLELTPLYKAVCTHDICTGFSMKLQ